MPLPSFLSNFILHVQFSSVSQSCPTLCDPMNGSTPGFPVLLLSPRICLNSCPLSWWHHPTISSSVVPFSSCLQLFPAPGSFPVSRLFTSGGQSTEASASASVLAMNIHGWFPLGLTDLLTVQGTLKSFLKHHSLKASILQCSAFFMVQLSHLYMTTGNIVTLTIWTFCLQSDVSAF